MPAVTASAATPGAVTPGPVPVPLCTAYPVGDNEFDILPATQLEAGNEPLFNFESSVTLVGNVSISVVNVATPFPVFLRVSAY